MLIYANEQFFLTLLFYLTSLGMSLKWGEQIWYLNMESIEEKTLPVDCYHLSSAHMGPYTNCGIWNTARVLGKFQHLSFLGTFTVSIYSVFYVSLSFIIKLNSWVLKYLSTHPEYMSTWVFTYIGELNTHLYSSIPISVTHSPLSKTMSSCFKQKEGQSKRKENGQKVGLKPTPSDFTTHMVDTGKTLSKWQGMHLTPLGVTLMQGVN